MMRMRKRLSIACLLGMWAALAGGCATDGEVSQKEKDRMQKEMARQEQKRAQEQAKMMGGKNQDSRMRSGS